MNSILFVIKNVNKFIKSLFLVNFYQLVAYSLSQKTQNKLLANQTAISTDFCLFLTDALIDWAMSWERVSYAGQ